MKISDKFEGEIVDINSWQDITKDRFLQGSLKITFADGSTSTIPFSGFWNGLKPKTNEKTGKPYKMIAGTMDHYTIGNKIKQKHALQGSSLYDSPHLIEKYKEQGLFDNRDAAHEDTRTDERSEAEHDEQLPTKARRKRKA